MWLKGEPSPKRYQKNSKRRHKQSKHNRKPIAHCYEPLLSRNKRESSAIAA